MVPGDQIEWVCYDVLTQCQRNHNDKTFLWSTPMDRWIIVSGAFHVLMSIDDRQYCWLSDSGLFCANVDDDLGRTPSKGVCNIMPRKMQ